MVYNFQEGLTHDWHVPVAGINLISNHYKWGPNSKKYSCSLFIIKDGIILLVIYSMTMVMSIMIIPATDRF